MVAQKLANVTSFVEMGGFRQTPGSGRRDQTRHERERRIDLIGLRAAGLGEVRTTAALAADALRDGLDDVAGLEPAGQVLSDARNEEDLVAFDGPQHDDARAEL